MYVRREVFAKCGIKVWSPIRVTIFSNLTYFEWSIHFQHEIWFSWSTCYLMVHYSMLHLFSFSPTYRSNKNSIIAARIAPYPRPLESNRSINGRPQSRAGSRRDDWPKRRAKWRIITANGGKWIRAGRLIVSWREDGTSSPMEIDADCINLPSVWPVLTTTTAREAGFQRTKNNADILSPRPSRESLSSFHSSSPRSVLDDS